MPPQDPDFPTNIRLRGPEFAPAEGDVRWAVASPKERLEYWTKLGEVAVEVKRAEILRGIGANGRRLKAVKTPPRLRGGAGPPLIPREATSRTYRLLAAHAMVDGATLFWRGHGGSSWARILGYHAYKKGARALPVRNTIGISPKGRKEIAKRGRQWWEARAPKGLFGRLRERIGRYFPGRKGVPPVVYLPPGAKVNPRSKAIQVHVTAEMGPSSPTVPPPPKPPLKPATPPPKPGVVEKAKAKVKAILPRPKPAPTPKLPPPPVVVPMPKLPTAADILAIINLIAAGPLERPGLVPIPAVRRMVASRFGAEAASHAVFDRLLREMRADGLIRMIAISDYRDATQEELDAAIPGLNETIFYIIVR